MHCSECGAPLEKAIDVNSTRLYVCDGCATQKIEYIEEEPCKHEYNDKSGDRCIHCGEPRIHFAE